MSYCVIENVLDSKNILHVFAIHYSLFGFFHIFLLDNPVMLCH